ncbi:MAG: hypothetical protein ABSB52_10755 [Acidimicrobiales bacterium]|jgi:hypothetical protein
MKARSLTFYIEPDHLEEVVRVLDEQIVPEYRELPNFVGLVVLQADHVRREVLCLSIWDRDMEASEEGIARFRRRITSVSGARQLRWRHSTSCGSCALVVRNLAVSDAFSERALEEQRRKDAGLGPRRRKRRRRILNDLAGLAVSTSR